MSAVITLEPPAAFINANDRMHHAPKAKLTAAWRKAACDAVNGQFIAAYFTRPVHITVAIRFANNIRRDVGNLYPTAKAIVDGLVDAQLLTDDSDLHVIGPDMRREWPNGEPRVTVTVTAVRT